MSFNYKIFHHNINIDIAIDILKARDELSIKNDIDIAKDTSLLKSLSEFKKQDNNYYKTNLKKTVIYIKNIALFNIYQNGSSIRYVLENKSDMTSFFSKLLNHVIPYALYMQKKFLLHASGVAENNNGILFLGKSGAGKSSLAASLKKMSFACEDSAYIEIHNNKLFLLPSFNLVKLQPEIHKILKLNTNKVGSVEIDKLNRHLYEVNNFLENKVKLKRCYILKWGKEFKIEKVSNKSLFRDIYSSVFGPHPFSSCKESELFIYENVSKLLNTIDFYILYRNKNNLFANNADIIKHIKAL